MYILPENYVYISRDDKSNHQALSIASVYEYLLYPNNTLFSLTFFFCLSPSLRNSRTITIVFTKSH